MGIFIGRDMLLDHMDQVSSKTSNELKGLKGELEVGDLLAKYLPDDTYVIAQPVIGKYEPDFLVISPRYGFRLIEVKNWSLSSVRGIESNGAFTVGNNKTVNPLQQVRKHVDDLKGYLVSNHSYIGDSYKLIGYINIQCGFNRRDLGAFTKNWSEKNANDFFAFHIFKDELNSHLDERLLSASKFRSSAIPKKWIEDITKNIRVSNSKLSHSEMNLLIRYEEIDRTAIELKELNKQTKKMIEEQREHTAAKNMNTNNIEYKGKSSSKEEGKENKFIFGLVFMFGVVIAIIIISSIATNNFRNIDEISESSYGDDSAFTNLNIQQAFKNQDNLVRTVAMVEEFHFDNSSENKFLLLDVDGFTFQAIIYKDTKTPYINKGNKYTFYGVTQEYDGEFELKITTVE